MRTNHPQSPHRFLSDVFIRYNARENYDGDRLKFNEEHIPQWWHAAEKLPTAKKIAEQLMADLNGKELGMVLLTKIPAHTDCLPHIDGGWHARTFEKFAVQIKSAQGQAFHFDGKQLSAQEGECYWFDNSKVHWVTNDSDEDRMTLIICIRRN